METLVRSACDWIHLLEQIRELKAVHGSSLFDDTLFWLEQLKQNRVGRIKEKSKLLDLMISFQIQDIDIMILFIQRIKNIYYLDSIIQRIQYLSSEYHLDFIALFLMDKMLREVPWKEYSYGYQRAYFPEDVFPKNHIDLRQNNGMQQIVCDCEYVLETTNFFTHQFTRTYYTSYFCLRDISFVFQDNEEKRKEWLSTFFRQMRNYSQEQIVHLQVIDPNQSYFLKSDFGTYEAVQTDGIVKDTYGNICALPHDKITICSANFVIQSRFLSQKLSEIECLVHPEYWREYNQYLENQCEEGLLLFLKCLENKEVKRILR